VNSYDFNLISNNERTFFQTKNQIEEKKKLIKIS